MLFLGTALKVHRILQLILYGCYERAFVSSHGVGTMLLSNVAENTFQFIRNQASKILVLSDLCINPYNRAFHGKEFLNCLKSAKIAMGVF